MARLQAVYDDLLDERLRLKGSKASIEMLYADLIYASGLKQRHLSPHAAQTWRRGVRPKKFAWMGLETQYGGWQAKFSGLCAYAFEQGLVAEVHAIEVTDGEYAWRAGSGSDAPENPHKAAEKRSNYSSPGAVAGV